MNGADENSNTELMLALVRIEGKLDVIDARIDAMASTSNDHENRLRVLEKAGRLDERLAALEMRPVGITPRVFLTSMVGVATIVGSIGTVVTLAVGK